MVTGGYNIITFSRDTLAEAAQVIASDTGQSIECIIEALNDLIEKFQLLTSAGNSVTLKYAVPACRLRENMNMMEERLRMLAEKALESIDRIEYVHDCLIETPYQQPPYINRLHPRRDYQRRPYWLRTRSNPTRRNYH